MSAGGAVCVSVCARANVDALRPHMLLQELGYALLPSDQQRVLASSSCHLAICPLHQRQFPFLSLGLKRNDTCETNCHHSFVSICQYKKPSHPFQKYNCAGSLFPIIRHWVNSICLPSYLMVLSKIVAERHVRLWQSRKIWMFSEKSCLS